MIGGEKILASREGAAEGGCGGSSLREISRRERIPPRPSVPPEPRTRASSVRDKLRGGGQFRSKNVRAELYNSTKTKQTREGLF